jgi:sigma-B regulation protein RsbU (phosphoserine phosphatase)
VLVAAFACRHLPNYRLFAVRPYAPLAARLHQTRVLMGSGLLLVFLLVGTIGWRLREGVWRPTRALLAGVQAMATRAFDHRITVATGDEWDDLPAAFNQTLATMEELEVASVIQARLFPAGPVTTPAGTFLGRSRTTQEVGGDYFDALPGPDGTLFFLMGDVTGHGVSAALVVAMAKSAFGYLVRTGPPSPAAILDRMSALFREQLGRTLAMTCQIGCLHPDGTLRFANAGHLFPFLLQPGQPIRRLEQPSVPLGMRARRPYVDLVIDLPSDARLLFCTDGIIEATDPAGKMFGFTGLTALLAALPPAPPAATIEAVFAALAAHTREVPWADDVTVAILCRSAGETA